MDGTNYFQPPSTPSQVDETASWRGSLWWTAISVVLVVGGIIALDFVGVHIPVIDEIPTATTVR